MKMATRIKVVIADDHDLFRDGLSVLLSRDEEIEILGEAPDGKVLVDMVSQCDTDVIITDLMMPEMDGVQAIKKITASGSKARILALSTFDNDYLVKEALEAGAFGYVVKNAQRGEIAEAVKTVYAHHPYYCRSTSSKLVRLISNSRFNPYTLQNPVSFSDKEKEIIRLICADKKSEEIAAALFMSKRTVDGFRSRILEKMNVKTAAGVAIYAIKNGMYLLDA